MTKAGPTYVEIFFSKPSWSTAYIQRRDPSSTTGWASPGASDALVFAEHIREQFRVYRCDLAQIPGGQLEFVVTNGSDREWDTPPGVPDGWHTIGEGGRWVVEHGCRKVGEVDLAVCENALKYATDKHITVEFVADLWNRCFFAYGKDGGQWVPPPGDEMELKAEKPQRRFEITIEAKRCVFALNNGGEGDEQFWDSNHGANFLIGMPGKYYVSEGAVQYIGRADADVNATSAAKVVPSPSITKTASATPTVGTESRAKA